MTNISQSALEKWIRDVEADLNAEADSALPNRMNKQERIAQKSLLAKLAWAAQSGSLSPASHRGDLVGGGPDYSDGPEFSGWEERCGLPHNEIAERTINPQLILAGARLAIPGKEWFVRRVYGPTGPDTYTDFIQCADGSQFTTFNPLQNDGDAWALCDVLERRGIIFKCIWTPSRDYYCWHYQNGDMGHGGFETKQEAMLAALSAMTNIPMFAEVGSE